MSVALDHAIGRTSESFDVTIQRVLTVKRGTKEQKPQIVGTQLLCLSSMSVALDHAIGRTSESFDVTIQRVLTVP